MSPKREHEKESYSASKIQRIIPVLRVKHVDLYSQWYAKCMLKDVWWLCATQINHSFFDVMRLYMVITFVICLGFFTIGLDILCENIFEQVFQQLCV